MAGGVAALPPGAEPGVPVVVFETVEYRLYRDASGYWWLGTRSSGASGWTATSPIAGPLSPHNGLELTALDVASRPTVPESAAAVRAVLRAPRRRPGGTTATESLALVIRLP
jgi:hypothetical protein